MKEMNNVPVNIDTVQEDLKMIDSCYEKVSSKGPMEKFISKVSANRQLILTVIVHLTVTVLVWQHFFFKKYTSKLDTIPRAANRYWWKVLTPSFEFGVMHVILFQMALLPLTMSRYLVTQLSETWVKRYFPFGYLMEYHFIMGYIMVGTVFASTIIFFAFFGLLCNEQKSGVEPSPNGEMTFCTNFTMEIMATGYAILALLLIVGGTSYLRYQIPYEVFYVVHHVTIVIFAVTIAHTLDIQFRKGLDRSQTFKWFSAPLLIYFTDRFYMWCNKSLMGVAKSEILGNKEGKKSLILTLNKPHTFGYNPGQYVYLKAKVLDSFWHPFSVASEPNEKVLRFYIDVYEPGSWSHKLWELTENGTIGTGCPHLFEVTGPYGTSFDFNGVNHLCLVGAGTGIVPMMSAMRSVTRQFKLLQAEKYISSLQRQEFIQRQLTKKHQENFRNTFKVQRPFSKKFSTTRIAVDPPADPSLDEAPTKPIVHNSPSSRKYETLEIEGKNLPKEHSTSLETAHSELTCLYHHIIFRLLAFSFPLWELVMASLTLSWHHEEHSIFDPMRSILEVGSYLSVLAFSLMACLTFDSRKFPTYIDILISAISLLCVILWSDWNDYGNFNYLQVVAYFFLGMYRALREWCIASHTISDEIADQMRLTGIKTFSDLQTFRLVWVDRSADRVMNMWSEIERVYAEVEETWGVELARKTMQVEIHITDPDCGRIEALEKRVGESKLFAQGALKVGRPDLSMIVLNQLKHLVVANSSPTAASRTLVSFCGKAELGTLVAQAVEDTSMIAYATNHRYHSFHFYEQHYGSGSVKKGKNSGRVGVEGSTEIDGSEKLKNLLADTSGNHLFGLDLAANSYDVEASHDIDAPQIAVIDETLADVSGDEV